MKNKILWLSILGLALARPPNPINSTASNIDEQQKQRISRSIWPFSSSETTTEEPVNYPPALPENNEWFVQGETPLPQGIDLKKYPVWKVHKYNGIDLHPVNLQPENTYPPELHHAVESPYSSGSSLSSDFPPNSYQNGYQDFGTYPTGYPAAYPSPSAAYPAERENYQTGEFQSSSFTPGANPFNVQTQQKYEIYAPAQPLTDFRSTSGPVVPEPVQIPLAGYGRPNTYQTGNVNYQGHNQEGQKQGFAAGEAQSQSTDENKPDLSFLDDLGGLAPFLPEPTINKASVQLEEGESPQEEATEAPQEGFLETLFSRFRGSTEEPAAEVAITETEKPANSGGFLSSIFGFGSDSQSPESASAVTESSGNAFSSLFYRSEAEKPAVVQPTTYYLPKTRGSYIAIKVPTNSAPSFAPSVGPYDDVSNIAFHEVPKVPFSQHEIPHIPSPTLDSGYPYNPAYSEVRHSGFSGSVVGADYQPVPTYDQPRLPASKIAPQFTQNYGISQQSDLGVENYSLDQGAAVDSPRAEYLHSGNNNKPNTLSTSSSQPSPATNFYQSQQNSQDSRNSGLRQISSTGSMPLPKDELPKNYVNTVASFNAGELDQNQNEESNQSDLSNQQYQFQNFDTTNSNFQGVSNTQETFDHNLEPLSLGDTVNNNEPKSAPQISGGFVPSLGYGTSINTNGPLNFNGNNQENSQQTINTNENIAYDQSSDNGDTLTQNFDTSSILSYDLVLPKEREPDESSVPVYQTPVSALQNPSNAPKATDSGFLSMRQTNDFRGASSDQNEGDTRFIKNLAALTSYGTPTNSYDSNSFGAASSNVRTIVLPVPTKDEVNDGTNNNMNKDVFRSTLSEQLPTKKVDRVVRKVMKRRNSAESNISRRSTPERQAPTEETDTSLIIRSEKDSIPEVRGSRQFDGARVIDGYSKVQHHQHHHQVVADTGRAMEPMNPENHESVQQ